MSAPQSSQQFFEAVKARRTIYALADKSPIPDSKIVEIVETAVKHCPSPFNSQSGRAVVLFGENKNKAWDIVAKNFLPALDGVPEVKKVQEGKIQGYKDGYVTVLVLEDQDTVKASQQRNPGIKDAFPIWSENSTGMLQWIIWTALSLEGLGANLQHHASYHPGIDPELAEAFGYSKSWKVTALLNAGQPTGEPNQKTFMPLEERVKVIGA